MHVVIVGCGRVGSSLAGELEGRGHSVAVLDKRPEAFARLHEGFTGRTVTGPAIDRDRLIEAGIEEAGALAAVTSGDNSNVLVARIAKESFEVANVIARIYDPGRAALYQRAGIPTVATVSWSTDQALRRLLPSETRTEWVDPTGSVALVERTVPTTWAGRPMRDLDEPGRWSVTAVTRGGAASLPLPTMVVQEGDIVLVVVAGDASGALDERLAGAVVGGHR